MRPFTHPLTRILAQTLGIPVPPVYLAPKSVFRTPTQMGAYDTDTGHILIRETLSDPDRFFTLAHELRHLWQLANGKYISDYSELASKSVSEYNDQEADLDANAFADLVMRRFAGLSPLFSGMDASTVAEIRARSKALESSVRFQI